MDLRRLFKWTTTSTMGAGVDPAFFPPPTRDYVSIETAEENLAVYRAIKLISGDIARLPVSGADDEELLERPNSLECWWSFVQKHIRYLMLYGNSFALISRNGLGRVVELISCSPQEISIVYDKDNPTIFTYRHSTFGVLDKEDILHWRIQGSAPFFGTSPITVGARALNLALTQEQAGQQMYQLPSLGKVAIESPETIGPDMVQKLQDAFASTHAGKNGHLKPIVTQGGMTVKQVGTSLSDSEWITARRFSITEVSRLYSIPPAFLYDLEHSTLENSASQMKSYVSTCLNHWIALFASEFYMKLGWYLNFDTKPLLRGTLREQTEALRMAIDAGMMTPNECRAELGLEPHPDGDELMISKNYQQAGVNGTDTDQDAQDSNLNSEQDSENNI